MKLIRHLSIVMENLKAMPTLASKEVNRLIKQDKVAVDNQNASRPNGQASSSSAYLRRYTDKSFIVVGLVDPNYIWPEGLHGQLVSTGNGEKAWQFSNKRRSDVAKHLGIVSEIK